MPFSGFYYPNHLLQQSSTYILIVKHLFNSNLACVNFFDFVVFFFAIDLGQLYRKAGVAQLVEQLICNHQVGGSSPFTGSNNYKGFNQKLRNS